MEKVASLVVVHIKTPFLGSLILVKVCLIDRHPRSIHSSLLVKIFNGVGSIGRVVR